MRNLRKIALRAAAVLFGFGLVAVIAGRIAFNTYLNSPSFQGRMNDIANRALKAQGELMPLHLSGATAYTDGYAAEGTDEAFFSKLRADQLRADFNWRGLLRKAWQIDQVELERLDLTFADHPPVPRPSTGEPPITKPKEKGWTLDLRQAAVRSSHWRWTGGEIDGAGLTLTPEAGSWLIAAKGGTLRQASWPDLTLDSARLRYQPSMLYITDCHLRSSDGTVAVTGEIDMNRAADLQVTVAGIDLAPLLEPDWRARFTGRVSADAKVHAPLGNDRATGVRVEGTAQFAEAQLTALPVLDQIALFTQTQRFRKLAFTRASLDFTQEPGRFVARNVVAESEGLIRMEGEFTLIAGQLEGNFQVGVTAASLRFLPGSQERVFTTSRNGYLWASMHIFGPVAHPTEDLTPRLAQAATGAVVEKVENTVRDLTKSALDLLKPPSEPKPAAPTPADNSVGGAVKGTLEQLLGR